MRQRLRAVRAEQGKDGGFTLTELLIVIVILGVLTGIVVFAVGTFANEGELAACKADKKVVEVAVEAYRAKTGTYPSGTTSAERFDDITPEYMRDPPNSTEYTVEITDNSGTVVGTVTGGATGTC